MRMSPAVAVVIGLSLIAFVLLPAGCYTHYKLGKSVTFVEEVVLDDGTFLNVRRSIRSRQTLEIRGGGGYEVLASSLEILPISKSLPLPIWKTEQDLVPMLLESDSRSLTWTLIAIYYACTDERARIVDWYPYAQFRLVGSEWVQEPLGRQWHGHKANLLTMLNLEHEPDLITSQMREQVMTWPGTPANFREITSAQRKLC